LCNLQILHKSTTPLTPCIPQHADVADARAAVRCTRRDAGFTTLCRASLRDTRSSVNAGKQLMVF
jgi:hypothetical protein